VIQGEIDVLGTERKIQSRVRKQMESNQRDYYLNEQMKAAFGIFAFLMLACKSSISSSSSA
jgi:hypothetical protein